MKKRWLTRVVLGLGSAMLLFGCSYGQRLAELEKRVNQQEEMLGQSLRITHENAFKDIKDTETQSKTSQLVAEARGLTFKYPVQTTISVSPHQFRGPQSGKFAPAYYNDETKTIYLKDDQPLEMQQGSRIKATARALLDQNFDLVKFFKDNARENNEDCLLALESLVEGDCTLVMTEILSQLDPKVKQMTEPWNMPPETKEKGKKFKEDLKRRAEARQIFFSHKEGSVFVKKLKESGGWEKINQAYRNPPCSTEQILHPEKYLANELPVEVSLPVENITKSLGEKCKCVNNNVLGEFGILTLLSHEPSSYDDSAMAAEGWAGDRLAVFRIPGEEKQVVRVLKIAWDSEEDAQEFKSVYKKLLPDVLGTENTQEKEEGNLLTYQAKRGCAYLQVTDKMTLVIQASDENLVKTVFATAKLQ